MNVDVTKARSIFSEAVENHAPDQWDKFLDGVCGEDLALRRRVELLLKAHQGDDSFLDRGDEDQAASPTLDLPITEKPGTQIGPYKLLQEIGQGGMGVVYMAEQTDPVKRRVALKIIKPGMDTQQVIARFEAERQALSLMEHPNIAKVLDAGRTGTGRPYFVMELVKGQPITDYCDQQHLTPRQRLELFVPVCQAIQHAHQKGIIHRDVKPSNVLVAEYDGRPVAKVIDFGVAKAISQPLTEKTVFTGLGQVVGTLEYMSPEQARVNQLDVDTRSDIYSLGVLLYELLTGSTPFDKQRLRSAAWDEMLRMIREEEPPKPSTRLSESKDSLASISAQRQTEPAKLTRLVRGELDWIVMKALEKDRNRRYETANGFALDLQRYLADEAVQACPPSAGYRLRKFARRNKTRLVMASVIGIALLLAVGSLGWTVRDRGAREEQAVRERQTRQAKLTDQVDLILSDVDRLEAEQKWPEALAAARRAEAAAAGGEADVATAQRVRQRLEDLEFLDRLEQIRMQRATVVDNKFDDAGADRDYTRAFRDYGVDVGALAVETSIDRLKARPELAIPLAAALDDWVGVQRRVSAEGTADWKQLVAVARGIDPEPLRDRLRASWGRPVADVQDDLNHLAQSIDIRTQRPATLVSLARTLRRANQSDAALRLLRDSRSMYPGDFWLNFELGNQRNEDNEHEEACRFLTAAVSVRPHAVAVLNELGNALRKLKKLDEATDCYRKAIELDPKCPAPYMSFGALLCDELKQYDQAIECFRTALELDPKDANVHHNLGNALRKLKKLDEATDCYRKAIELDPKYPAPYMSFGALLCDELKQYDQAIECFRTALELDPKDAKVHHNLGIALSGQNKLDEAIAAFRKAIELDPNNVKSYSILGAALYNQNKLDEAIAAFRKAIELDPKDANAHSNLGAVLGQQGKLDEAMAAFSKAIELDPKDANAHSNLGAAYRKRAGTYAASGQWANAAADFEHSLELDPKNDGAWRKAAYAYLAAGDAASYRRTCRELVERFGQTDDPVMAERTAKVCSLAPGAVADFGVVERLAQVAVTGTEQNGSYHYFVLAKGLTEDRAGRHAEAVKWLERFAPKAGRGWHIDAIAFAALAMAQHRLGRTDEAKETLARAKAIVAEKGPDPSKGRLFEGNWNDWLHAQMLSREAEDLIGVISAQELASLTERETRALDLNNRAWSLATSGDPQARDPHTAVELAQEAVKLAPNTADYWNTLGVAQYRDGNFKDAISSLQKYRDLRTSDAEWTNPFFLAMAHWKLGEKPEARQWFDRGVEWMEKKKVRTGMTPRVRGEAAELLDITQPHPQLQEN